MHLAPFTLPNKVFVAPMAGVTDRPFRQLCKRLGAGYAVSEMAASNPQLWASDKTTRRLDHGGEIEPRAVQIAGSDPAMLAHAARYNVERGAQVIDINMGCPAKKVCKVAAGSALLKDESLVGEILDAVVDAATVRFGVPVTLKFRTGWSREHRNAVAVARMAQSAGIRMLTLHGRTRADLYTGAAEYDTIAAVAAAVSIPVVANGDIDSPERARYVLDYTRADAIMVGRAAQGNPWIFREISHYLETGTTRAAPSVGEARAVLRGHLLDHYAFYGEFTGLRSARKHIGWYVGSLAGGELFRQRMNALPTCDEQLAAVDEYLATIGRDDEALRTGCSTDEARLAA